MGHGKRKRQPAHSGASAARPVGRRTAPGPAPLSSRATLWPTVAAAIVGAVCGVVGVLLTSLGEQGCNAVPARSSCGSVGVILLVAVTAGCILLGALLLRALSVPDAVLVSFFGVAAALIVILWFFLGSVFSTRMLVVVPLLTAAAFAVSAIATKALAATTNGSARAKPSADPSTKAVEQRQPAPVVVDTEAELQPVRYGASPASEPPPTRPSAFPPITESPRHAAAVAEEPVPVRPRRSASISERPQHTGSTATSSNPAALTPRPPAPGPDTARPKHASAAPSRPAPPSRRAERPKHAAATPGADTVANWPEPTGIPHQPRHASRKSA
jgi:hypothetical protein